MYEILRRGTLLLLFAVPVCALLPAIAEETPTAAMAHPRDTALIQQPDGGWRYTKFPEGSRLYVHEGDSPGQSNCNAGCASAWPPLLVSPGANNVGDWAAMQRDDGRMQWSYKGQPVYYRFHNLQPSAGQLEKAGFRILEP